VKRSRWFLPISKKRFIFTFFKIFEGLLLKGNNNNIVVFITVVSILIEVICSILIPDYSDWVGF